MALFNKLALWAKLIQQSPCSFVCLSICAIVCSFFRGLSSALKFIFFINHATSSNLYWSYYPHWSRELGSPICGIIVLLFSIHTCLQPVIRREQSLSCVSYGSLGRRQQGQTTTITQLITFCLGKYRYSVSRLNWFFLIKMYDFFLFSFSIAINKKMQKIACLYSYCLRYFL